MVFSFVGIEGLKIRGNEGDDRLWR